MKKTFIEHILKGGRFEGNTPFLPHAILPDLYAYLEIVVALAKDLFFQKHSKKKRISKGFESKFGVGLVVIKSGSTVPIFERDYGQGGKEGDEFDQARDLINEELLRLATSDNGSSKLSEKIVPLFNRFGQHLNEGETVTLRIPGNDKSPVYSREIRSKLLSINKKPYSAVCHLSGFVSGFEAEKGHFYFTTSDKESISGPLNETFDATLRNLASKYKKEDVFVNLVGIAKYNPDGSINQIERLQHIAIFGEGEPDYFPDFKKRLTEFLTYKEGWLDGKGHKFEAQDLEKIKNWLDPLLQESDLPAPFLYPSPDKEIIAEWSLGFWEVACVFDLVSNMICLHATDTASERLAEDRLPFGPESLEKASKFLQDILSTYEE
jgi:hypothetical protein